VIGIVRRIFRNRDSIVERGCRALGFPFLVFQSLDGLSSIQERGVVESLLMLLVGLSLIPVVDQVVDVERLLLLSSPFVDVEAIRVVEVLRLVEILQRLLLGHLPVITEALEVTLLIAQT